MIRCESEMRPPKAFKNHPLYIIGGATIWVSVCTLICINILFRRDFGHQKSLLQTQTSVANMPSKPKQFFIEGLPFYINENSISKLIDQSSTESQVRLDGMRWQNHLSSSDTIGHSIVSLSLHGSYPSIKKFAGDIIAKAPYILLKHISIRRATSQSDLDSTIELDVITRPSSGDQIETLN